MVEIDAGAFEREVLAASAELPVLVDFWAPWCGACRMLGPVLESLEESNGGRFKLVKINADESPKLARRYGVRSVPFVVAFVGGEPVDNFVGAEPEGRVSAFIERVIPRPAELERLKARRLLEQGQLEDAATALREAIALDPAHDAARLDLVNLLLERMPPPMDLGRLAEAEAQLAAVGAAEVGGARQSLKRARFRRPFHREEVALRLRRIVGPRLLSRTRSRTSPGSDADLGRSW